MNLKFQLLHPDAQLPEYAHPTDSGMDVRAVESVVIAPGDRALVATGLSVELPMNMELQVRPRSGLAVKHGLTVLNAPGTIDEGYRGEIKVSMINHGSEPFTITSGMKIAQLVLASVSKAVIITADTLTETDRGACGFGSTGI